MKSSNKIFIAIGLIAAAIATRFIPHAPNFTAVGAAALFGGVIFKNTWKAFLIPLLALFLSDLILNNFVYAEFNNGFTLLSPGFYYIYGAFVLTVLIGRSLQSSFKVLPLAIAGVGSALVFYLITNFGSWLGNPLYPQNLVGLMESYAAGLPFLANQVLGTLSYGAIMFGAAWFALRPGSASAAAHA